MQKLLGQVRRCVEDYRMIDAGDTAVSYTHLTLPTIYSV